MTVIPRMIILLLLVTLAVGSVVVATSAGVDRDPNESLILHYEFDGEYADGETVRDRSSSGNDGVYVGDSTHGSDGGAYGLRFSEQTGHVSVALDESALAGDFTVTARVWHPRHGYHAGIVSSADQTWRLVTTADRYEFRAGESTLRSGSVQTGDWNHLAVVHRNGTFQLYVNGTLADATAVSTGPGEGTILVGRRSGGYPFEGWISDLRVYDRALTEPEIRSVEAGTNSVPPVFYSDVFRSVVPFWLAVVAFLAAVFEIRYVSR